MSNIYQRRLASLRKTYGHRIHQDGDPAIFDQDILIAEDKMEIQQTPVPRSTALVLSTDELSSSQQGAMEPPDDEESKKTQASIQLQHFMDSINILQEEIISHEADILVNEDCACGRTDPGGNKMRKTTKCLECSLSPIACNACFVDNHTQRITHWAHVWNDEVGCFVRKDISCLDFVINIGHGGDACPHAKAASDIFFQIIDTNGVHDTKLRFCNCHPRVDRARQLLKHRLFPATMTRPSMAFTFQVLDLFNLLQVEGKISAYDFIGTIRRMTDNAFPSRVADPYSQFRLVSRVWGLLSNLKRQGKFHATNKELVRMGGGRDSLIVRCPACPHPEINMEATWAETPSHLRHINQHQWTADGNFHLNKYTKNTDPDDVSLYGGLAYFPPAAEYEKYLKSVSSSTVEKVVCDHLKAFEKQNRKKFKNMDVTGVVQIQCSHVIVKATADLQRGERFANTDFALATAIRQHHLPDLLNESMGVMLSYDINCGYSVNASSRFENSFRDLTGIIKKTSFLIPLLHVQNHKNDCMYLHASSYTPGAGHFHGETAEMTWAESNQLGAQTRQMNGGHRQDTLINATSDWNWKKTANMANSLMNDIRRAQALFREKRDIFKALSGLYSERLPVWAALDRTARRSAEGVQSVYRVKSERLPSQSRVYELLLHDDKNEISFDAVASKTSVSFLSLCLSAAAKQRRIVLQLEQRGLSNKRQVQDADITKERTQLQKKIDRIRALQKDIMPAVEKYVADQNARMKHVDLPEREKLFMPSDFNSEERQALGLSKMGDDLRQLVEGAANDAILLVQKLAKVLSNSRHAKAAEGRGQVYQTRAIANEQEIIFKLDLAILDYNSLRRTLIDLGMNIDDVVYRPLTVKDTFCKPTVSNRNLKDTYRNDGLLWTSNAGVAAGARPPSGSQVALTSAIATQRSKPPIKRKATSPPPSVKKTRHNIPDVTNGHQDGWIWAFSGRASMSPQELQDWLDESDRVQWFRAEAEMQRWQEEWEIRLADYTRCVRYFGKMCEVWNRVALEPGQDTIVERGRSAYARKKARMYDDMRRHADKLLAEEGYGNLLDETNPLHVHLDALRERHK